MTTTEAIALEHLADQKIADLGFSIQLLQAEQAKWRELRRCAIARQDYLDGKMTAAEVADYPLHDALYEVGLPTASESTVPMVYVS